jgi:hypothetical protein
MQRKLGREIGKPCSTAGFISQQLYSQLADPTEGVPVLVATARYLAAHAPTMRSQEQTYQMAYRLHRGDRLFEDTELDVNAE